jgi:TetR/AcrR family transcriptional regulator, fatty acid metabolism regulator protein
MRSTEERSESFIEKARRAQIVGCAVDAIAELGYGQASMARIAERAGISKSVISYHFGSKDELVQQVVTDLYAEGAAYMAPPVEAETSAAGKLRVYIASNIEFIGSRPRHVLAVAKLQLEYHDPVSGVPWGEHLREAAVDDVERILRRGQRKREFRDFSPHMVALAIRAAIDEVAAQMVLHPGFDLRSCTDELVTLFDLATRRGS